MTVVAVWTFPEPAELLGLDGFDEIFADNLNEGG